MTADGSRPRICLFGIFGNGNFGNECTLQAMLSGVRRYLPHAEISCICSRPEETSSTYNIPAFLIKETFNHGPSRPRRAVVRLLRWVFVGIPMELYRCGKAIAILRNTDLLVMTGTGMLGDFGITALGLHYDILRWSILARICRCKLLFVSVGAGPIKGRMSRYFVKSALALADYRSYRDNFSKDYLTSIGFDTTSDAVYPDLAFSLPITIMPDRHNEPRRPVVGVGLMTYYDKRSTLEQGETVYHQYINTLASFVTWLLEHRYSVRLIIGDAVYDTRVMHDLRQLLKERGVNHGSGIVDHPISSATDVLSQLATTDLVVASRFHNVLLALMLNKPVVSISYHAKIDSLMAGFGLATYCQDIDHLDLDRLIMQLTVLEKDAPLLKPRLQQTTDAYRKALDNQYDCIFNMVGS
jgi:polysaccharide pyruvyl transferase WcaK-like protein